MICPTDRHERRRQRISSPRAVVVRCGKSQQVSVSESEQLICVRGVVAWIAVIVILMAGSTALVVKAVVSL